MAQEITVAGMAEHVHPAGIHLNNSTCDSEWEFKLIRGVRVLCTPLQIQLALMVEDLETKGMKEQVLPCNDLIEVKAGVAVFSYDSLFYLLLLFQ